MKAEEFKAWFEGFTENIYGTPTDQQWEKIKAKIKMIDNTDYVWSLYNPSTYNTWISPYRELAPFIITCGSTNTTKTSNVNDTHNTEYLNVEKSNNVPDGFDPLLAMKAMGRAEYSE